MHFCDPLVAYSLDLCYLFIFFPLSDISLCYGVRRVRNCDISVWFKRICSIAKEKEKDANAIYIDLSDRLLLNTLFLSNIACLCPREGIGWLGKQSDIIYSFLLLFGLTYFIRKKQNSYESSSIGVTEASFLRRSCFRRARTIFSMSSEDGNST